MSVKKRKEKYRKPILLLTLILVLALSFSACGNKEKKGDVSNENKDSIKIFIGDNIFDSSLDPVKGGMSYGYPFTNNALTKVSPDADYIGDLAESWKESQDAMEYTFKLKKGIKFQDDSDFTAEDVVFTYEKVKENQGNNENVDLTALESVVADDDYTVTFKLKEPYSSFLDQVALLGIVPSDSYDSEMFDTQPIGTGAWKVIEYDTDQKITLEANKDYFDKAPQISRVTIVNMDPNTAISNAKAGELDMIMVAPAYAGDDIDGMHIEKLETIDVRQISLPGSDDVSGDPAVREALNIGIDREAIIENALNGIGKPAYGFTENLSWGNPQEIEDGNVEKAQNILESAGWAKGDSGIYEKDGKKCQFTVIAPSGDEERFHLLSAVAEDAKGLGIQIDVDQKTWDEIPDLQNKVGVIWGWGQYDPIVLKNLFYTDDPWNTVSYSNSKVDEQLDLALSSGNRDDAIKHWKEAQNIVSEANPYLYIVNIMHCYFVSDKLDISVDTQIPHPHGHGAPAVNNMNEWTYE